MAKINAPGELPSAQRVEGVARRDLGLEDSLDESVPAFYTPLLTQFLIDNPGDTNFLTEFTPGTGFGTITCMEDLCWSDTVLTADPDRTGGGRDVGLGSLYEYALHCQGKDHSKSRDKRLAKLGLSIPPPTPGARAIMPEDIASLSANAGPSSSGLNRSHSSGAGPSTAPAAAARHPTAPAAPARPPTAASSIRFNPYATAMTSGRPPTKAPFGRTVSTPAQLHALAGPSKSRSATSANASASSSRSTLNPATAPGALGARPLSSSASLSALPETTPQGVGLSSHINSSPLASRSVNLPDRKPFLGMGSSSTIKPRTGSLSSEEDDIMFVGSSGALPNGNNEVSYLGRSSASSSQIDQPLRSSQSTSKSMGSQLPTLHASQRASSIPPWSHKWQTLTLSNKRKIIMTERKALARALIITQDPVLRQALSARQMNLSLWQDGPMMQWQPPSDMVVRALPDDAYPPIMDGIINRPDRKPGSTIFSIPVSREAVPSPALATTSTTQAGASTTPMAPTFDPNEDLDSKLDNFIMGDHRACRNAFTDLSPQDRLSMVVSEERHWLLKKALGKEKLGPQLFELLTYRLDTLRREFHDKQEWSPPSFHLLEAFPGLKYPLTIEKYLPKPLPGGASAQLPLVGLDSVADEELEYERDRLQGTDVEKLIQLSLDGFEADEDVDAGLKTLKLSSLNEKISGANFTMMPHQVLGVAFMVKSEQRKSGPYGGFLLDAMGLGKTVQCISLMLLRDKRPTDFEKCPQLIVAPLALLAQWKAEIETKTSRNWRILVHHGPGRPKSTAAMKSYDIVLTTYGTLMSESGLLTKAENKKKKRKKRDGLEDDDDDDVVVQSRRRGPLFATKWFRVILDEGHLARNKNTRTSKAVLELNVLHPWILTGTPIVNSLADLGPGLDFVGKENLKDFQKRIASIEKKRPRLAAKRCQVLMRPIMMRRTKDTLLNGKRILELPPKITNLASLHFEAEERAIYASLEQRARVRVNKFIQRGTLMKNYSVVLQLLTRLRQCVNHPWLLRRKPGDVARDDDLVVEDDHMLGADLGDFRADNASEYGRAVSVVGADVVEAMVKKLRERYEAMVAEGGDSEEPHDMECSICYEPFDGTEIITPCPHIYCKGCISSLFTEPMRNGSVLTDEQIQLGCRSCPMCRVAIWPGKVFRAAALFEPPQDEKPEVDEAEESDDTPGPSERKGKKRATPEDVAEFFGSQSKKLVKGKGKAEDEEVDELKADIEQPAIVPSTKMRHLLELVQGYLAEDENAKILVFSQFVEFLDLLRDFLKMNNIDSLDYRGSMAQPQREEAIRRFNTSPAIADSIPIMLISTKAGGVGLNLTMANKVIMCELAWNPATEDQAVDRAHRIGQSKQVNVERLVIADSVEDRLLEIQKRKGLLAAGAMGEGDVGRLGRLSEAEIKSLFRMDREWAPEDD